MSSNKDHFVQIGQVLKSNGTDGQVIISLSGIDAEDISEKEPLFIFHDGLPVPYFISSAQRRGHNKILAYLTDCCCIEDAEELAGCGLWLHDEDADDGGYIDFTGWTLRDESKDLALEIKGVEEIPGNPCLIVGYGSGELLVPLHEDLIGAVDEQKMILDMTLPEGLLDS